MIDIGCAPLADAYFARKHPPRASYAYLAPWIKAYPRSRNFASKQEAIGQVRQHRASAILSSNPVRPA